MLFPAEAEPRREATVPAGNALAIEKLQIEGDKPGLLITTFLKFPLNPDYIAKKHLVLQ